MCVNLSALHARQIWNFFSIAFNIENCLIFWDYKNRHAKETLGMPANFGFFYFMDINITNICSFIWLFLKECEIDVISKNWLEQLIINEKLTMRRTEKSKIWGYKDAAHSKNLQFTWRYPKDNLIYQEFRVLIKKMVKIFSGLFQWYKHKFTENYIS